MQIQIGHVITRRCHYFHDWYVSAEVCRRLSRFRSVVNIVNAWLQLTLFNCFQKLLLLTCKVANHICRVVINNMRKLVLVTWYAGRVLTAKQGFQGQDPALAYGICDICILMDSALSPWPMDFGHTTYIYFIYKYQRYILLVVVADICETHCLWRYGIES